MGRFYSPFANFPPQNPYCSFSQNMSSRKDVELLRDRGGFLLELPHCWNNEILNIEFQVENAVIWGGEEFLLAMLLKPYTSMSQICPSPHGLRIRFYTVQPPLYILGQTRAPCIRAICCPHPQQLRFYTSCDCNFSRSLQSPFQTLSFWLSHSWASSYNSEQC